MQAVAFANLGQAPRCPQKKPRRPQDLALLNEETFHHIFSTDILLSKGNVLWPRPVVKSRSFGSTRGIDSSSQFP